MAWRVSEGCLECSGVSWDGVGMVPGSCLKGVRKVPEWCLEHVCMVSVGFLEDVCSSKVYMFSTKSTNIDIFVLQFTPRNIEAFTKLKYALNSSFSLVLYSIF